MAVNTIAYGESITRIIGNQTADDIKRTMQDGFIAIRDEQGKLMFRYHPILNRVEIQHRRKTHVIDLREYQNAATMIEVDYTEHQSATSAANQGGADGRFPNE